MKKWLIIVLAVLVLILVLGAVRFMWAKEAHWDAYEAQFDKCLEKYLDSYASGEVMPPEVLGDILAQDCLAKEGCFDTCGSPCALEDPYLSFGEWLTKQRVRTCATVCVPVCTVAPQSFSR